MTWIRSVAGGVRIACHVQPRAARSTVEGEHGGALKFRLAAPPVDGAANDELIRFLAGRLGVPRSRVVLVGGAASRRKVVEVTGVAAELVRDRLAHGEGPTRRG